MCFSMTDEDRNGGQLLCPMFFKLDLRVFTACVKIIQVDEKTGLMWLSFMSKYTMDYSIHGLTIWDIEIADLDIKFQLISVSADWNCNLPLLKILHVTSTLALCLIQPYLALCLIQLYLARFSLWSSRFSKRKWRHFGQVQPRTQNCILNNGFYYTR